MDDDDGTLDDEKALCERVGYGSPPVRTRWKKGQSPNPAGRPRARKSRRTMLANIAFREVTYQDGGRSRKTTTIEAVLLVIKNKAIAQNKAASRLNDELLGCQIPQDDGQPLPPRGVLFVPERMTEEEWEAYHTPERMAEFQKGVTTSYKFVNDAGDDSDRTRDNDNESCNGSRGSSTT